MTEISPKTNKSKIEMNMSKEADLSSVNELYSKLENVMQKKKVSKPQSKPLIKYTNLNSHRVNKNLSSSSVPSTREKSRSYNKDRLVDKKNNVTASTISDIHKKDSKTPEVVSGLLQRMKEFDESKKKKIEESQLKRQYEIIKSCVSTPKINEKSRLLCNETDFFKRMNRFEENKEIKTKTLKEKIEEKRLSEVRTDYKKIPKAKIEQRVNSMMKWDNERKEKIYKKFKNEENKCMVDCTFKPEINKLSKKIGSSKVLGKIENNDSGKRDKSHDKNYLDSSNLKLLNNNSYVNSVQTEDGTNGSARVVKLKNKEIKSTKKDEEIIEQLLKERFKILKMKYGEVK